MSLLFSATVSRDWITAFLGLVLSKVFRFETLSEGVADFDEGSIVWPLIGCLRDLDAVMFMTIYMAFVITLSELLCVP
jgi:hypothetical protein